MRSLVSYRSKIWPLDVSSPPHREGEFLSATTRSIQTELSGKKKMYRLRVRGDKITLMYIGKRELI